jgi:hypothetical protein
MQSRAATAAGCLWLLLGVVLILLGLIVGAVNIEVPYLVWLWFAAMLLIGAWLIVRAASRIAGLASIVLGVATVVAAVVTTSAADSNHTVNWLAGVAALVATLLTLLSLFSGWRAARRDPAGGAKQP